MMRVHAHDFAKMMRKLRRGVDRNEWFMSPQTVNAYHAPNLNDIAFPRRHTAMAVLRSAGG